MAELPVLIANAGAPRPGTGVAFASSLFVVLAGVPLAALASGSGYVIELATRVMIFAIAAIALDLMMGFAGRLSFGHAAFIGIGAYVTAICASSGLGEALLAMPAAMAASMLFAFLTGIVCLRTQGVYFIMITLAFAQMAYFVATSLAPYGGDNGMTLAERNKLASFAVLAGNVGFFYLVLASLLATFAVCRMLVGSRFGRVLRGGKENPVRMAAIGFDVYRCQLIAYVISGGFAGAAGYLLANATEFVSPAYMSWQRSGELIIMVVLGGVGSLYGPILGSAAYLLLQEVLAWMTEDWQVIFGPLLVLLAVFAPGGLLGLGAKLRGKLGRD